MPAAPHVAQQLLLAPASPVTEIMRIRHLNREPMSLKITYLPDEIGERLRKEDLAGRDIFLILKNDYGIALGHANLQIDAMLADRALAGAMAFDCRTGDFHVIRAKTVILSTGAAGRLGLPSSDYLSRTFDTFKVSEIGDVPLMPL